MAMFSCYVSSPEGRISETVLVLQLCHESNSKGATAEKFGENGLPFCFVCMSNPGTVRFTSSKKLPSGNLTLKDRITPHVTNFFRLRLTIEQQEGKRKYKSDGAVMVGEFVCMYVCSCTVNE